MRLARLLYPVLSDERRQVGLLDDQISDVPIDFVRDGEQSMVEFADVALALNRTFPHHVVELAFDGLDAARAQEKFKQPPRPIPHRQFQGRQPTGAGYEPALLATVPKADVPPTAALSLGRFDQLKNHDAARKMVPQQLAVVNEAPDVTLPAEDAQIAFAHEAGVVGDGEQGCQIDRGGSRRGRAGGHILRWSELLHEATLDYRCVEIQKTSLTRSFGTLQRVLIFGADFRQRPIPHDPALFEPDGAIAEAGDDTLHMRSAENRLALRAILFHSVETFLLEAIVADGKNLVNQHDFGVGVDGDPESQPEPHATRIGP